MRIITWNCNMAFRKKAGFILAYKPDILIVPECEQPQKLKFNNGIPTPTDIFWYGDNHNKGLGVLSYSDYRFKLLDNHNPELKYVLPLEVSSGKNIFILFAVWAHNKEQTANGYIKTVWEALLQYEDLLHDKQTILMGDFNNNVFWDKPRRKINHSTVVEKLKSKNIHSIYHQFFRHEQGKEGHPTFYFYRNKKKPYHIDFCFASSHFAEKLKDVKVGNYKDWRPYSDHTPLMVEFDV